MPDIPVPTKSTVRVDEIDPIDAYKLTTSLIVPRPIGWIGTVDAQARPNLAPYSFFNAVSGSPPTFVFSPNAGARRDTLANCEATREFTVNIVTEAVTEAMNETAASLPAGEDEFAHSGLTAAEAVSIGAPLVAEARANFECRVVDIVTVPDSEAHRLVIGIATIIHIDNDIFDADRYYVDQARLGAVGRHAGNLYSRTTNQFSLDRPG